jgi:hypothetical protein
VFPFTSATPVIQAAPTMTWIPDIFWRQLARS